MTAVQEEKAFKVIDVIFEGWFDSIKTIQSLQNGVEQKSLKAFEDFQKELIKSTRDQLGQLEEESKKLSVEWKEIFQEVLKKTGANDLTEWTNKFEEVGQKAEKLAFGPSKKSLELFSKSQAQLENALKEAIDQQQKNRSEVLNNLSGFVGELKQTQNDLLKNIELYNPLIAK
jgi:histidinol dehydrogenase